MWSSPRPFVSESSSTWNRTLLCVVLPPSSSVADDAAAKHIGMASAKLVRAGYPQESAGVEAANDSLQGLR